MDDTIRQAREADILAIAGIYDRILTKEETGGGFGTAFVSFYEQYAKAHACRYLRMDTNVINKAARRFYAKLGFYESGVIGCVFNGIPDVKLVCLEKKLDF